MNAKTVDTRDGKAVAESISNWMNGRFNSKKFCELMASSPRSGHNFIVLALQWLYALSKVNYWDARNEGSVLLGKRIAQQMELHRGYDFQGQTRHFKKITQPEVSVHRNDISSIVLMFSLYLSDSNLQNGMYQDFLDCMLYEHNTLQQLFTCLCKEWCRYVVEEKPFGRTSKSIALAKAIAEDEGCLPYI